MPCYDPRGSKPVYVNGVDPEPFQDEIEKLKHRLNLYEAKLCAIFNELERRGISGDVAVKASRNGLVDVMKWYMQHKKNDEARLEGDLHKYSVDEQQMMLKILKQQLES